MALVAEYELAFDHLPLVDVASAVPETTLELEVGQPNHDGSPPLVVRATGNSFDEFERALDDAAFLAEWVLVVADDPARAYRLTPRADHWDEFEAATERPEAFRELARTESVVDRIEVTPDGWVQTRRFADRGAFEEYLDFWRDTGSFALHRLSETDPESDDPAGLTAGQREALLAAREHGYFEVPREASLGEIADELGVSTPALSERLRRANRRLVDAYLADAHLKPLTD